MKKQIILIIGLVVIILAAVFFSLIAYMNVSGSEIEKICTFIDANKTDSAVFEKVREADYIGPGIGDDKVTHYVYETRWVGGPSCNVETKDGKILKVTYLID